MEYPKHENLYKLDKATNQRTGELTMPEVDSVGKWLVTEKVDGMNIRVIFNSHFDSVLVKGRTDAAIIPKDLEEYIRSWATYKQFQAVYGREDIQGAVPPDQVVLYGEGYGAGIQKGGHYRDDKSFILFDVAFVEQLVGRTKLWWGSWKSVTDAARGFRIHRVPVLGDGMSLEQAKGIVWAKVSAMTDHEHFEGIVARTDPYMFDQRGKRITFKYKVRDL